MLESLATLGLLLTAYALVPIGEKSTWSLVLRLIGVVLLTAAVLTYQVWIVSRAERPALRAARGLLTTVALFLICFAGGYLSLSYESTGAFNTSLDRVDALYFTVTVFTTVGFGDIVPVSESARIVVSIQMLLNLALLGAGLRVVVGAARMRMSQRPDRPEEPTRDR